MLLPGLVMSLLFSVGRKERKRRLSTVWSRIQDPVT